MFKYRAKIIWKRAEDERFVDNKYSRGHQWEFDGGVTVPASASPDIVPLPYSVESNVDPEEAFVASISSCHMLVFLDIASQQQYVVDKYIDNPIGIMKKDAIGKLSITRVTLRAQVTFSGEKQPSVDEIEKLHHQSHELCFIANSVKTEVVTEIIP